MSHFSEILRHSADNGTITEPSLPLLTEVWTTLVGDDLAMKIQPGSWHDGILTIVVVDKSWAEALRGRTGTLRARMQRFLPWKIRALAWSIADPQDERFAFHGAAVESPLESDIDELTTLRDLSEDLQQTMSTFDEETRRRLLRIRLHAIAAQAIKP